MNYTLHHLQVFLKVTTLLSITKAASELNLSQPAVSIQLKNFQDQFDVPLYEVIGKKIYVTDFGKEIAIAAENILNEVYTINYKTLVYKGQISGRLKLSIVSTGTYLMPYLLADFLKINTGVELQMDVTNKSRVIESLKKNEVDFSLISTMPEGMLLNNEEIITNNLVLVCNTDIYNQMIVMNNKIFEAFPFIHREEGSATRTEAERFFNLHKLTIKKKIVLTSNETVKQAVIAGLGISIMPLIGIKNELQTNELKIIPLDEFPIKTKWQLVWHKEKQLSPAASALLAFIRTNKSEIIEKKFNWLKAIQF